MKEYQIIDELRAMPTATSKYIDYLGVELNARFHYYGEQIRAQGSFSRFRSFLGSTIWKVVCASILPVSAREKAMKNEVISSAYGAFNDEVRSLGFKVFTPPWFNSLKSVGRAFNSSKSCLFAQGVKDKLAVLGPLDIELGDIDRIVELYDVTVRSALQNASPRLWVVPEDEHFFNRHAINMCSELNIRTAAMIHGLPALYNGQLYSRADYVLVWSEFIKELFIQSGVRKDKILNIGFPGLRYSAKQKFRNFSTENVLVLSRAAVVGGSQYSGQYRLYDRSDSILYALSVKRVLSDLGIKGAVLRPHPSESISWYEKMLGNSFYHYDSLPLKQSLQKSSLVIGPTTTVMLEALQEGIPYISYEPFRTNAALSQWELVPPFDGTDPLNPVAFTPEDLSHMIKNKVSTDPAVYSKYVEPFKPDVLKKLLA